MNNDYHYIIHNNGDVSKKDQALAKELFPVSVAREARKFHRQIPGYKMTPLEALPNLAHMIGVGGIYIKDEAQRLELNSFKVMGGSFAIYRFMKKLLGMEDQELSFEYLVSKECHHLLFRHRWQPWKRPGLGCKDAWPQVSDLCPLRDKPGKNRCHQEVWSNSDCCRRKL